MKEDENSLVASMESSKTDTTNLQNELPPCTDFTFYNVALKPINEAAMSIAGSRLKLDGSELSSPSDKGLASPVMTLYNSVKVVDVRS